MLLEFAEPGGSPGDKLFAGSLFNNQLNRFNALFFELPVPGELDNCPAGFIGDFGVVEVGNEEVEHFLGFESLGTGDNIFEELMDAVRICSLGQITKALYDVGGQYRRNM